MEKTRDILLVELPPWDPRTAPLGIAYLATFLRSKGINAKVFDLNIEMYNSSNDERKKGWGNEDFHWWQSSELQERYMLMFDQFIDRILSFDTRVIGFSATLPSIPFLNHLLKRLKKRSPDKIIIVGGPATFFKETRITDFDRDLIDYFVIGDGEIAIFKLLINLNDNGKLSLRIRTHCNVWKDNLFERVICIQTPKIMDLNTIPPPTFEEFDLSLYTEGSKKINFTLPIIFSKGCTRCCTFCSDRVLSYPYRCRKAENVVKEISMHLKRYNNIYSLRLNDLSFNANLVFIDEFCDTIIAEDIRVKWYGQAQVRPEMGINLLSKMKRAGCRQFDLGLESLCDHVLSMMRKGYTSLEAIRFLKATKEAGIETNILLIVGYPGETEEDFKITLENIKQNARYIDRIGSLNICGMPVGSELRIHPEKHNFLFPPHSDWVTTDYTNTYEVRKRRYNEVIRCCNELNIPVEYCLDLEIFENIKRG